MERLSSFTLHRPLTIAEAVSLLAETPAARPIAGGTDLVPNLRDGLGEPPALVDLSAIDGFDRIESAAGGVTIGAGTTLARLAADDGIRDAIPALAEAATTIAGPGHRTMATIGGNLCLDTRCVFYNQSAWWRKSNAFCLKHDGDTCHVAPQGERCHAAFSGDLAPVLLVLGVEVDIAGSGSARRMPLADLYVDDGAAHLTLARDELLVAVHVPAQPPHARCGYRKARARGAIDFPLAGVAARAVSEGGVIGQIRVALTGTNPRPFLLDGVAEFAGRTVDDALLAQLGKLVQKQVSPMRTTVTGSNYRRQVAAVLAQRLVRALAGGDGEGGGER